MPRDLYDLSARSPRPGRSDRPRTRTEPPAARSKSPARQFQEIFEASILGIHQKPAIWPCQTMSPEDPAARRRRWLTASRLHLSIKTEILRHLRKEKNCIHLPDFLFEMKARKENPDMKQKNKKKYEDAKKCANVISLDKAHVTQSGSLSKIEVADDS